MVAGTLLVLDGSLPDGLINGSGNMRYAQTMAFTTLVLFQMFNAFNSRSDEQSAFVGLFRNHWLVGCRSFAPLTACTNLSARLSASIFDRAHKRCRLAALRRCCQLGVVDM
jgi:magnesium-transporting ATPase (P-type)